MFCSNCGNKVSNDDTFCYKCGLKIKKESYARPEVSSVNTEKASTQNVVYQNNTNSTYSTNNTYSTYQPIWNDQVKKKNENNIVFVVLATIFGILSMIMIFIGSIFSFVLNYETIIFFYAFLFVFLIPLVFVMDALKNINELRITKIVFMSLINATLIFTLLRIFIEFLEDISSKNNYIYKSPYYSFEDILQEYVFAFLYIIILIIFIAFSTAYMLSKNKNIKSISLIFCILALVLHVLYFIILAIVSENINAFTGSILIEIYLLTILFGNLACNNRKEVFTKKNKINVLY